MRWIAGSLPVMPQAAPTTPQLSQLRPHPEKVAMPLAPALSHHGSQIILTSFFFTRHLLFQPPLQLMVVTYHNSDRPDRNENLHRMWGFLGQIFHNKMIDIQNKGPSVLSNWDIWMAGAMAATLPKAK